MAEEASERRRFYRVPLDVPHFVTLAPGGADPIPTLLVDMGRGGLQLAFPPGGSGYEDALLGLAVVVRSMPAAVAALCGDRDEFAGQVSWISPQRCGIRFDNPLEVGDEELAKAVEDF